MKVITHYRYCLLVHCFVSDIMLVSVFTQECHNQSVHKGCVGFWIIVVILKFKNILFSWNMFQDCKVYLIWVVCHIWSLSVLLLLWCLAIFTVYLILTLRHGVMSTARHSENITCRGVTSTAHNAVHSHSFVCISIT